MSRENDLLVGKEQEAAVSEALARVDETISLLERCGEGWNQQTGLLDDTRRLRSRLTTLLRLMEGCRERIEHGLKEKGDG